MTILVHTATAAVIGQYTQTPILAFIYGLISHIILDLIPHGDDRRYHEYKNKELSLKRAMAITILDAVASVIFVLFFFNLDINNSNFVTSMAIIGGIVPDVFIGFYEMLDPRAPRWLQFVHRWHFKNHGLIAKKYDFSRKSGVIFQIAIFFLLLKIL